MRSDWGFDCCDVSDNLSLSEPGKSVRVCRMAGCRSRLTKMLAVDGHFASRTTQTALQLSGPHCESQTAQTHFL
jgi:hypothetical protein